MERRVFGPTGAQVPALGLGTWMMEEADRASCLQALRLGLDLGMTHVDTAEMYGDGAVEELVGEALVGRRDEVYLVSKVLPSNASYQGTLRACERSLRRLRTDRLDCYLLHWPGSIPLEETFRAFEALVAAGKIRAWGVSNFAVDDLEAAWAVAGPGRIACNQVLYHLKERYIEHVLLPWCERHDVAVVGYAPFGHGDFPSPTSAGGRVLAEIAREHGVTPRQVALSFLVRRPSLFSIPKSSSVAHTRENAGAAAPRLSEGELRRIDEAFPLGSSRRGLPVL